MNSKIIEYPSFSICLIEAASADEIPEASADKLYRIEIPYHRDNINTMIKKGYLFADRTIGVTVNLRNDSIEYKKMIRFDIRPACAEEDDILRIALTSFPFDSRFHVRPVQDDNIASEIICSWVDNMSGTYVCVHKGQIVGFLDLEPYGDRDCFVWLAAVKERYRAAGAAVSMYAKAVLVAKEKGYEKLHGRISSGNTAVMNLYASLGGTFSEPWDVFVRNE